MKRFQKTVSFLLLFALLLSLTACGGGEAEESDAPTKAPVSSDSGDGSWAVYWYLCGSDLETNYGCATNDLVEMLEVATQNRKNRRILCCSAQVFTRVNKGLREQVNFVYKPITFLGCFTWVRKFKPKFDSEGNVLELKSRGSYCFVHTDELRAAYDTYKVIHTLAKEGFKEPSAQQITNVYLAADGKKR